MKKAAIFIDSWKLATFHRVLTEAGFSYTQSPGLSPGTMCLSVETETIAKLHPVVNRAQKECRK